MATTTIDSASSAYQDYVAVVINGQKPSERAKEEGKQPSSVSANVKRIREALANGATVDGSPATGDSGTGTTPTPIAPTIEDIAASMHPFGAVLYADRVKSEREVSRMEDQIEALNARLNEAREALTAWDDNARESAGFNMDEVRARFADETLVFNYRTANPDDDDDDAAILAKAQAMVEEAETPKA